MISIQSIEDRRRSAMMNDMSNISPTNPAVSPYSDQAVSPYSDTIENEDGTLSFHDNEDSRISKKSMRFFDIDVEEEEGQTIHDQLPSVEEVKVNAYFDNTARRKKRNNRYSILMGLAIVVVFAITLHGKKKRDRYQSAITSVTTTLRLSRSEAFLDRTSPQSRALRWMMEEDSLQLPLPSSRSDPFVQRYTIAVLVFSLTDVGTATSPILYDTRSIFGLLSSGVHECGWNSKWKRDDVYDDTEAEILEMGILCDKEVHSDLNVTGLVFRRSGLQGQLPPELEILSNLRVVDLANNKITGTIPAMSHLRVLNLSHNEFAGSMPEHFSEMTHLTRLSLSNNAFEGWLPTKFASLTNLEVLDLTENQLTGGLEEIYSFSNIEELYLGHNWFNNKLTHTSFQGLSNLRVIDAKENRLSGPLPNALWRLTRLEVMDFHRNSLDGHINNVIAENHPLKYLDVSNNILGGGLPTSIQNLESLTHLDISYNRLDSRIPRDHMAGLTNLKTLLLTEDDGMGPGSLPTWLRGMTDLKHLSFRLATRTGSIPTWFGELTKLEFLDLDWNHISGTIPTELGLLTDLKYLMLNRNLLTGSVPTAVTYLPKLKILMLDTNDFSTTVLVGDEETCQAGSQGRIEHLIADCGNPQEEPAEQEVECPCCSSCCWDSAPQCNMVDWGQTVEQEYRGSYGRVSDVDASFEHVP